VNTGRFSHQKILISVAVDIPEGQSFHPTSIDNWGILRREVNCLNVPPCASDFNAINGLGSFC
jgi:hypothetical protein